MPLTSTRALSLIAGVVAIATQITRAAANERPSIDADFPLRMEDAHPVDLHSGYAKLIGRYTRQADATDLTLIQPEIAYGFAQDFDVHLLSPLLIGDGDRTGSGDLSLDAQWLFLDETPADWWPAMAIEAEVTFPTGVGSDGLDVGAQLNVSKTLVWAPTWDSLHLNVSYTHNFVPAADERREEFDVLLGYSRRVLDDTTFLADVFWERTTEEHDSMQVAEVGLIQEIGDHVRVAGGIGVGIGDDSPDFTATVGVMVEK